MLTPRHMYCLVGLLGFSFLMSCVFPIHLHPYRSFYQDAWAILGVFVALMASVYRVNQPFWVIPSIIFWPFILIGVIVIQLACGMLLYPADAIFPVLYLVSLMAAFILGATLAHQKEGLNRLALGLAYAVMVTSVVSVFIQQIQFLNLNFTPFINPIPFDVLPRPFGNIAQPNLLALVLCWGILSLWYLYATHHIKKWLAALFVIWLLWGIALTQARVAWLILPLFAWMISIPWSSYRSVDKRLVCVYVLIFIAMVWSLPHLFSFLGLISQTVQSRASDTSVRWVLWEQAWLMSQLHPWFGVGWFQFGAQQVMISRFFQPSEYSEHAHNIVLHFAAEIGWPITLFLVLSILYWFYHACIVRFKTSPAVHLMGGWLVALGFHSMVEYPLWFGFLLMPCGVIMGALHVPHLITKHILVKKVWVLVGSVLFFVIFSVIQYDYWRLAKHFMRLAEMQTSAFKAAEMKQPENTLFNQFYDYLSVLNITVKPGMAQQDILFLKHLSVRFGFLPIFQRLALALVYDNHPNEALQVLITSYSLNGVAYQKLYQDWGELAAEYPQVFLPIYERMPPVRVKRDKGK